MLPALASQHLHAVLACLTHLAGDADGVTHAGPGVGHEGETVSPHLLWQVSGAGSLFWRCR